jgi:hypothetical protein
VTPPPATGGSTQGAWLSEGVRMDGLALGFTGAFADSTSIQLNDGRWRMYVFASSNYRSAVSSDGLSFTFEDGARVPQGQGHMRVIRLGDGRIRAYNISGDGIVSSVSSDDGLTFTSEPGFRVSGSAIGFTPSGCSIVRMPNGTWRMYFSSLPRPGEGIVAHPIRSAFSSDLLNWTLDAGVRIGPGSTLSGAGEHPAAWANADGSVSLFYFRNTTLKMMMATARDGLTFTTESDTGLTQANDPDIVSAGGRLRMYYNWSDGAATGRVYSATYSGTGFTAALGAPVNMVRPAGAAGSSGSGWNLGFKRGWK